MYRNTTPTLVINLTSKKPGDATPTPLDPNLFNDFLLTIKCGNIEINKTKVDSVVTPEGVIEVKLTQEETLSLPEDASVKLQIKLFKNDTKEVIATNIATKLVKEILNEDVYPFN